MHYWGPVLNAAQLCSRNEYIGKTQLLKEYSDTQLLKKRVLNAVVERSYIRFNKKKGVYVITDILELTAD